MVSSAYPVGALALALFHGLAFSCVGIGYRAGQAHRIAATQVALAICVAGAACFAFAVRGTALAGVPSSVWVMALVAGTGQFIALLLMSPALARGPLSPVWCTVNLNFVLTIAYARVFLGETISTLAGAGIVVAVACVVAAALGQQSAPAASGASHPRREQAVYGLFLLTILIANSLWITGIKHFGAQLLPDGRSYVSVYGNHYALGVYLVLGLLTLGETVVRRRRPLPALGPWVRVGAFAAVGSIVGMAALNHCAELPASVVLTINSVASLLGAAVVSVIVYHERRTSYWYATVGLAVLAVVLVNVPGMGG